VASGPKLPPEIDRIVHDAVEEAIEEIGSSFEAYNNQVFQPEGRGFMFGSGTDGGYGGEAYVPMSYMIGTGNTPANPKIDKAIRDADDKAYEYAKKEWMRANKDFMETNGLSPDDIGYNELEERGFTSEAEDFDEYYRGAQEEEDVTFRLGAFYYDPENDRHEARLGEKNMYVFAVVDFDGHFLPSRMMTVFETSFAFKNPRDLKSKLEKALGQAVAAI